MHILPVHWKLEADHMCAEELSCRPVCVCIVSSGTIRVLIYRSSTPNSAEPRRICDGEWVYKPNYLGGVGQKRPDKRSPAGWTGEVSSVVFWVDSLWVSAVGLDTELEMQDKRAKKMC